MTDQMDELQALAARLVVGRKADGRAVYDEAAKAELVAHCGKPGASVSLLARQCGINTNQLSRWVREQGMRSHKALPPGAAMAARRSFVAVPMVATARTTPALAAPPATPGAHMALAMALQARLPNGVVLDLREIDTSAMAEVIAALGRVRCSVSTKA